MGKRILSKAMDIAADELATRVEPVLRDTFFRLQDTEFKYDNVKWEVVLAAITEKLPHRLDGMPIDKKDRMDILSMIDGIDRFTRMKGSKQMADTLFKSLVALFDLFEQFRRLINLRVIQNGEDITDEIFGRSQ